MTISELLALAEKATAVDWEKCERGFGDADLWFKPLEGWHEYDNKLTRGQFTVADAEFLAAAASFIRSPEFRAMAADAERYRKLRERIKYGDGWEDGLAWATLQINFGAAQHAALNIDSAIDTLPAPPRAEQKGTE